MTILFHGPSGSGKDTQVDLLVEKYKFENIGTGEMIRQLLLERNEDAVKASEYSERGEFVPNQIIYERMFPVWLDRFDPAKNWALVSVVREYGQISLLDNLLLKKGKKLDKFIHFHLSEGVAIERMSTRMYCSNCGSTFHPKYKPEKVKGICDKCGNRLVQREDDKPEKIKKRLEEYNRTISPILDAYGKRGILVEVDATPSIEEIHKEILKILCL